MRDGFTTDNGNLIIDVHVSVDRRPGGDGNARSVQLVGVVTVGLFALRGAGRDPARHRDRGEKRLRYGGRRKARSR